MLVYGDRKGLSYKTATKLQEQGLWEKFVEIDRMAVEAAMGNQKTIVAIDQSKEQQQLLSLGYELG